MPLPYSEQCEVMELVRKFIDLTVTETTGIYLDSVRGKRVVDYSVRLALSAYSYNPNDFYVSINYQYEIEQGRMNEATRDSLIGDGDLHIDIYYNEFKNKFSTKMTSDRY